jgi:hypothetical protein
MRPIGGAALLALVLAGCGGEREAAGAIPRARFVAANVALRTVPDSVGNAAALRQEALRKHRVNEKQLKGFVAAHGRDPEFMAAVWREIAQKVDSAYERTLAARNGEDGSAEAPNSSGAAPGVVGQPRTLEPPPEMPPPPPGGRPRQITERLNKKPPIVRSPEQPEQVNPSDARPRDIRPSQPMPPPRPDSAARP